MAESDSDDFVVLDPTNIQEDNSAGIRPQSPGTLQRIVDWLQPTAYDDGTSEYARHLVSHLKGTGDWLAETEEYRRWHDGHGGNSHLLWIKAAPGTGKSVIAAHQRAHLATSERAIVLYFFFRHIITTNRTPTHLVRDWIAQLLPFSASLRKAVKEDYLDKRKLLSNVTFEDLWDKFRSACETQSRVYCFADALDEMSLGHDDFFSRILQLSDIPACKVFVTSRPIPRIVARLRNTSAISFTLGPDNMSEDISTYVDHRMEKDMARYIDHRLDLHDASLGDHETRTTVKPLIRSTLQGKAHGSFLYSKLMLDNVLEALRGMDERVSIDKVRQVLDTLPTGLAGMYGDMLRDHARRTGTSPELQRDILRWITHSERPLRMLELATVLESVKAGSKGLTPADTKALVRTACGPLLEIMPSDVIGPVHHSFTEYLTLTQRIGESARNIDFIDSESTHRYILEQCLAYLIQLDLPKIERQGNWDDANLGRFDEYDHFKLTYPFLDYAMNNWPSHARKCGRLDLSILQLLDRFFEKSRETSRVWIRRAMKAKIGGHLPTSRNPGEPLWSATVMPLHVAAFVGLPDYVEYLLGLGIEANVVTRVSVTPLFYAASKGHKSALDLLLRAGADPCRCDEWNKCPLELAAEAGHADCVDRLMASVPTWSQKSSGNRLDIPYERPDRKTRKEPNRQLAGSIRLARSHLQNKVIEVFLKYLSPEEMGELFYQVAEVKRTEIGLAVINSPGFNVNLPIQKPGGLVKDGSPMSIAVSHGNVACVRALIERNARVVPVPTEGNSYDNLLHLLISSTPYLSSISEEDLSKIAELLIEAGIPVDGVNKQGHTPLYRARSKHAMAETLLRLGANVETAAGGDSTPLHDIAGDDEEGMKFWIQYGFDINARDVHGATPLHAALSKSGQCKDVVQMVKTLLKLGADPNLYSSSGLTPLHLCYANIYRDDEAQLYKVLLDAGADPNARDMNGSTPLMTLDPIPTAKWKGSETESNACKALIAAGADPAAKNILGETAFLANVRRGRYCYGGAKREQQWNSDIHVVNNNGSNAALLFCRCPSGLFQMTDLAEAGLDFKLTDRWGNTVIHNAALVETLRGQRGHELEEDDDYLEMLERLVTLGVDPGRKNLQGQAPLHFAIISGESVTIDWLLRTPEQRAKIDEADIRGLTALHVAACLSAELVLSLIDRGANPLRLTRTGQSALHLAAVAQRGNVAAALLACTEAKQKAFVNLADSSGRTALHYAARSGRHRIVKLLLNAGADPNIRDVERRTPLNVCADFRGEEEAWATARMTVQDQHGSFIRTDSADYYRKLLEQNVFDHAPAAMTKPWEAMARELSAAKIDSFNHQYPEKTSLRQSVKYLLSSGAEINLPEQAIGHSPNKQKFGGIEWDRKSAVVDALVAASAGHDSLLDELLKFLEAVEGGFERLHTTLKYGIGKVQIEITRNKEVYLKKATQSGEFTKNYRYAFEMFMAEDRADLAAAFLVKLQGEKKLDERSRLCCFGQLVAEGLSDAVKIYIGALGQLNLLSHEIESESWPMSLQELPPPGSFFSWLRGGKQEPGSGFEADHGLLTGLLNGTLLKACRHRMPNHETVKVLVQKGNISQREKMFALASMATTPRPWNLETIEYLVRDGADIDAQDPNGLTPLIRACHGAGPGHPLKRRVVKLLLGLGADVNIVDAKKRSCLDFTDDNETIKLLLEHGIAVRGGVAQGVLQKAVRQHNLDLIRLLLDYGLDLREIETGTKSNNADRKEIKRPRSKGKDSEDGDGESEKIVKHQLSPAPVSLLVHAYSSLTRLSRKKSLGFDEMVQALLDNAVDPFCPVGGSGTPAIYALLERGYDATNIITRPELDLERRDGRGRTLLLAAADTRPRDYTSGLTRDFGKALANLELLLTLDANLLATDSNSCNVLHLCATHGDTSGIVRKILDRQDSASLINARNQKGQRPVQLALAHGHWESAQLLVEHGADMTIVDPDGKSGFHHIISIVNRQRVREVSYAMHAPIVLTEKLVSYIEMGSEWEKQASLAPLVEDERRSVDINASDNDGEPPLFSLLRQPLTNVFENENDLRHFLLADQTGANVKLDVCFKAESESRNEIGSKVLLELEPTVGAEIDTNSGADTASVIGASPPQTPATSTDKAHPEMYTMFALLRRAGLTLDVKSRDGRGSLHAFASHPRSLSLGSKDLHKGGLIKAIWEKLVGAGLDPYAEDDEQRSALDVAAACGNLEILE